MHVHNLALIHGNWSLTTMLAFAEAIAFPCYCVPFMTATCDFSSQQIQLIVWQTYDHPLPLGRKVSEPFEEEVLVGCDAISMGRDPT